MHIIGFKAMKALGIVKCAKNALFRAKNAFYAHHRFQRNESTGKRANAMNYAKLG